MKRLSKKMHAEKLLTQIHKYIVKRPDGFGMLGND